ncbi:MAG: UMP kinase [Patescibacteria group bacterium]|jgi:uridylate kinase
MPKTFVVSVGGSLVVKKEGIQAAWLKEFRRFILKETAKGNRFYLVVGGGWTARQYIQSARDITRVNPADCDWVGISASRLNAQLVRALFGKSAHSEVIIDPTKKIKSRNKIVVAAGYRPGWSTDYVSVLIAKTHHADRVINLSNIDYAYDQDPRLFKDAHPLTNVSWPAFQKIVGHTWRPGLNVPFDPIASRTAAASRLEVVIMNGAKLNNLRCYLEGRKFIGTIIR